MKKAIIILLLFSSCAVNPHKVYKPRPNHKTYTPRASQLNYFYYNKANRTYYFKW